MNLRKCTRWPQACFAGLLVAGLVACGGGGGSAGTPVGTSATAAVPTITVGFVDTSGAATTSVSTTGGTAVIAAVRDAAGAIVANKLVTFTSDATLVTINPASALTNAAGIATTSIAPATLTAAGAGTVTATALVGTTAVTGTGDFKLSASNLQLQSLNVGSTALAAFGTRAVSVNVLVNGAPTATGTQVTFTASCGTISPATVTTNSVGLASTTYQANSTSCGGTTVTITAAAAGATSVGAQLAVLPPVATNIQFVSSAPQVIYLKGSTGATQSLVSFKVIDSTNSALQNQSVVLSLSNSASGMSLGTVGNASPVTLSTDATGVVTVAVFSGTVPTSLQVQAALAGNPSVTTTSNILTVASGLAAQSRTSLAAAKLSIEGFSTDGTTDTMTVSIADRQGNPVPDGTQINLTTESGVLVPPSCFTAGGTSTCNVQLRSQGSRPANGRVSILAYLPGEEDYVDANGNNTYDAGEAFSDLGNAYRDDNENGAFDTGEFVVPRAGATVCAGGTLGRANTCDGVWGLADVRTQQIVIFATSAAKITGSFSSATALDITIADLNGNSMPTGSTVAVTVVTSLAAGTCVASNSLAAIANTLVPSTTQIVLKTCAVGDIIRVTVTSPNGLATTQAFPY